jgi:hypothetical protein
LICAGAGDHAVGRRVLDQVFDAASLALCGEGQRAVFHESVGIKELGNVLARGALPGCASTCDRLRAIGVECEGLPVTQFGKVGSNVIEVDGGRFDLLVTIGLKRLEKQDRVALHQRDAGTGDNRTNNAAAFGADQMLHFHGFKHCHRLTGAYPLTRLHPDAHHRTLLR